MNIMVHQDEDQSKNKNKNEQVQEQKQKFHNVQYNIVSQSGLHTTERWTCQLEDCWSGRA